MSNEEMDITQQDSQTCNILINPTFLRTHLYVGGEYSSKAEQKVGDVNAVCKDIEFGIKVNVTDVSTEEVIRSYTLTEEEQNTLFNLGTTKVVIGNEYTLKMLSKQLEDDYVYYKQDDKVYVVREIHLTPSLSHSTKMLVTTFDYPQTELESVEMLVNNELLDGSINYIQFTEVSEDNRYLVFNVEVAPTYELEFEVITNANDRFKQDRQVSVEKVVVASATEGQELTVVAGKKYIGYWGQETLFNFNASSLFYESAKLSIEYEEDAGREEDVLVNQGVKYTVNYDAKVTIELIPQIYSASTYVEYQGVRYSVTENYGANGELPIGELVNASGINIFEEYGIKVSSSSTTGKYYSGDEIRIKYELNAELADDFMVTVYNNETKLYEESTGEYIAKILDRDVEIKLEVQAVPDVVVLTTTYPKLEVGEIYALVNGDEKIKVEGEYTIINLINGDMLEVYIKEEIGFEFTGEYEHKAEICKAEESEGEGEWEGYKKIVMFSEGFELTKKGWYDLIFKQIPIEVEYKYYTVVPEVEEVLAGQGYTITADTTPIQKGTKVTLIKGEDNVGYRFDGYTYVSPKGEEGSKEFSLTEISDKEQEFSIDEEILRNLREEEGKLVLTVYVNYVRQYKYEYDYRCNSGEVRASVIGVSSGKAMQEGEYYDYGTKMQVRVETVDSKHYKINVEMTNAYGNEIFNTETIQAEEVEVVEGSVVNTNLGSVAGFGVVRELRSNEVIRLGVEVEKYDTILSQKLQKTLDEEAIGETTSLLNQGNGLFSLGDNIYYEIEGTHEYGTEIEVRIHVIMPEESTEQYYTLTGARVNGKEATIRKEGTSEIDGCGSEVYVLRYSLRGEIPTSMEVELDFVALYFVQVGVTE